MSRMMKWHSALSKEPNTEDALAQTLTEIKSRIGESISDIAFVFVSPHHRQSYNLISSAIVRQLGPRHILGCSGGGVIGATMRRVSVMYHIASSVTTVSTGQP